MYSVMCEADPPDARGEPAPSEASASESSVPKPSAPQAGAPEPRRELPDLATRIREAQRQARERRVQQGLPAEADDGGYTPKRPRKHAPKRSKNHGQFLGTVADSWEATRRR